MCVYIYTYIHTYIHTCIHIWFSFTVDEKTLNYKTLKPKHTNLQPTTPKMLSVPSRILKHGPESSSVDAACSGPGSRDIEVAGLRGLNR